MPSVRVMPAHSRPPLVAARSVEVLPPVELSTERLAFRPLAMVDKGMVLEALDRSRDELMPFIPLNRTGESDAQLFARWVETAIETDNNRSAWRRAAFTDDGSFVGVFNLIKIRRGLEWCCETHWWLDTMHTGMGYATEGVQAVLDIALAELPVGLGLARVTAMVQPDNRASLALADRLGFVDTGWTELFEVNAEPIAHRVFERRAGTPVRA